MIVSIRGQWLAASAMLLFFFSASETHAQCRPESSFNVPNIVDVYAKRHTSGTTTLWFVHKISHEVVCGSTFCDGIADEYVWRSGSSGNSNVSSLSPIDSCGESMTLTPTDPDDVAVAVVRVKFGENYHTSYPPVHYPRWKNIDVVVDPEEVYLCECLFQLNCNSSTGACGETATLLASPPTCSIC